MALKLLRNMTATNANPFWGTPTSSVDWCEVTNYIAEFFNTTSSFAMVIVGLMGLYFHPWSENRFKTAFLTVVAVGLGSAAFHGTLWKVSQAFDEVPMLYSALAFLYIFLDQRFRMSVGQRRVLATILILHSALTTYLVTSTKGPYQFIVFHISFGTAQVYAVYQAVKLYLSRKRKSSGRRTRSHSVSSANIGADIDPGVWVFERGITVYLSAFIAWAIDMFLCEYLNPSYGTSVLPVNPQMHAWWHILVSIGLYNMALLGLIERTEYLGFSTSLQFVPLLGIPFIKRLPKNKSA